MARQDKTRQGEAGKDKKGKDMAKTRQTKEPGLSCRESSLYMNYCLNLIWGNGYIGGTGSDKRRQ